VGSLGQLRPGTADYVDTEAQDDKNRERWIEVEVRPGNHRAGVYLDRQDFVPPDTDLKWRQDEEAARAYAEGAVRPSNSGGILRDDENHADPKKTGQ
jgi:hypothetical protein